MLGSASPALIARLSFSTISDDVLFGAPIPNQPLASYPAIVSATGGTSGSYLLPLSGRHSERPQRARTNVLDRCPLVSEHDLHLPAEHTVMAGGSPR
jgi:hypothetical protein